MNSDNGYYQISVHPNRINYYYQPFHRRRPVTCGLLSSPEAVGVFEGSDELNHSIPQKRPEQFADNYHHGKISKTAERKINRAIDYIIYLSKPKTLPKSKYGKGLSFRLNFITLTLSSKQIHSDYEIMSHCFRPFLMALNRKWKVNNYIWRAERQSSGSLHYHVITDRFIPWNELRNVWNRCQQNLGYVSRYRENQLLWHRGSFRLREDLLKQWPLKSQLRAYRDGVAHDWNSPNSTDVHSLRHINNVRAYFKKYMTKTGQSSDISGRLWGCSLKLSRVSGAQVAVYSKIDDDLEKLTKSKNVRIYQTDFYTVIFVSISQLVVLGCSEIVNIWREFLLMEFPDYYDPEISLSVDTNDRTTAYKS